MLPLSHRGGLWVVWPLKRRDPRPPENHTVLQQNDSGRSKPQKSLLLGEEEGSAWALVAQREKDASLEDANLRGGCAFENSMDPCPSLVPSVLLYKSHKVSRICRTLRWAQRSRNEVPVTFAHKSSLSSVWSGVGTWGALKVNVTFRGCGRCPDNEKNRDWPWEGREGEGLASLICKGTGQRWVKRGEKQS